MNPRFIDSVLSKKALTSVARTNGTVNGDSIDRQQAANSFNNVLYVILTSVLTDGVHTITVMESDDNSSFTDAAAADQNVTSIVTTATTDNNKIFELSYHGQKRYARLKIVTSGATTGGIVGAVAILGNPRKYPTR